MALRVVGKALKAEQTVTTIWYIFFLYSAFASFVVVIICISKPVSCLLYIYQLQHMFIYTTNF